MRRGPAQPTESAERKGVERPALEAGRNDEARPVPVTDLLATAGEDFKTAADRLLKKNEELYQRLA